MGGTGRDNDRWLFELQSDGPEQQAALSDLRVALVRGLRHALAHSVSRDDSFIEDAVQESLLRILDRISQFEGRSRFLTWAIAIAIRGALSEPRPRHWQDVSLDEITAGDNIQLSSDSSTSLAGPDKQWERKALLETMQELIQNELTEKQRAALIAELRGMPQEEIARHLGSNRNAIYKLTHDARRRLKHALEAAGYDATDVQSAFVT